MPHLFKSKVDTWLAAIAIGPGLLITPVLLYVLWSVEGTVTPSVVVLAIILVLGVGAPLWIFRSTTYEITHDTLKVRSGPLRQEVPLAEIERITTSRSLASAPALSLDRMQLTFRGGRTVLVSPEDPRGFLAALARAGVKAAEGVSP